MSTQIAHTPVSQAHLRSTPGPGPGQQQVQQQHQHQHQQLHQHHQPQQQQRAHLPLAPSSIPPPPPPSSGYHIPQQQQQQQPQHQQQQQQHQQHQHQHQTHRPIALHHPSAIPPTPQSQPMMGPSHKQVTTGVCELDPDGVPATHKIKEGDWTAVFNPAGTCIKNRTLDINLLHTLEHGSVVCCIRFSANGKFVATGCNKVTAIYDVESGDCVRYVFLSLVAAYPTVCHNTHLSKLLLVASLTKTRRE